MIASAIITTEQAESFISDIFDLVKDNLFMVITTLGVILGVTIAMNWLEQVTQPERMEGQRWWNLWGRNYRG